MSWNVWENRKCVWVRGSAHSHFLPRKWRLSLFRRIFWPFTDTRKPHQKTSFLKWLAKWYPLSCCFNFSLESDVGSGSPEILPCQIELLLEIFWLLGKIRKIKINSSWKRAKYFLLYRSSESKATFFDFKNRIRGKIYTYIYFYIVLENVQEEHTIKNFSFLITIWSSFSRMTQWFFLLQSWKSSMYVAELYFYYLFTTSPSNTKVKSYICLFRSLMFPTPLGNPRKNRHTVVFEHSLKMVTYLFVNLH